MANFSRVHEDVSITVANSTTSQVIENIPVKGYEELSINVRSGVAHGFDVNVIKEGFYDTGAYGFSYSDNLTSVSSGGNQIASDSGLIVDSPEITVEITNNDTVSHDYDVFVGGQSD